MIVSQRYYNYQLYLIYSNLKWLYIYIHKEIYIKALTQMPLIVTHT